MVSLSGLDHLWSKSKLFLRFISNSFFIPIETTMFTWISSFFFFHSSSPELDPTSDDLPDNNIELPSIPSYHSQRSHSSPSVTCEDHSDPQSVIENFSDDESTNPRTVFRSSPSNNSEQNDSIESLNSSLPVKQPRIDHRRNKSEPVKSLSNDDLKSPHLDEKTSLTSSRKKKAWYNVSQHFLFVTLHCSVERERERAFSKG